MQENKITEEYLSISDFESKNTEFEQSKLKKFLDSRYFIAVCVVLVAVSSFVLGRVSKMQDSKDPIRIIQEKVVAQVEGGGEVKGVSSEQARLSPEATAGAVIGSKNGTKYHYPWCAGAKQIADKNKIIFNSIEEARAKGYTPASNCKGLK